MSDKDVAVAISKLATWLETMRQSGGYGGPVAHWWQNRYRYTGPGHDWRYEGLLTAYATLFEKTSNLKWLARLERAASDLIQAQDERGHYRNSRFEINPGTLGTPHEAAASLGLLRASRFATEPERLIETAKRNLDALINALYHETSGGFSDAGHKRGRVPNKLATLAQALLSYADISGEERYLDLASLALDDVVRFQEKGGRWRGAVHQLAPDGGAGDGRFFPYYNARCIPPLVIGAKRTGKERYWDAAETILDFLTKHLRPCGSWPQILYQGGQVAEWPHWGAGAADILLAYAALDQPLPFVAMNRILALQHANGAFPTAYGFASQISQRKPSNLPSYRDVTAVVGWNDKVFRLLAERLPKGYALPEVKQATFETEVLVGQQRATYLETDKAVTIGVSKTELYRWHKASPWAETISPLIDIH